MHITTIICEYNPLHSGHAWQIARARECADKVVCIMSGSFVQRGEPAFYDKWTRARWALCAGADMVVELPCIYSLRSAEYFAAGAINLAHSMGLDSFCFGAENDDVRLLQSIASLHLEDEHYRALLQGYLDEGMSYPAAQEAATTAAMALEDGVFQPNNILGIEYIKAAMRLGSHLQPLPVKRMGDITSSACRQSITCGKKVDLPGFVLNEIPSLNYVTLQGMSQMLLYKLRMMDKQAFESLPDISEGLENRIYTASRHESTLDALLSSIAVKRYPMARIKRILCLALLGVCDEDLHIHGRATYAHILGMRRDAGCIVERIRSGNLLATTRAVQLDDNPLFAIERRATDIRALAEGKPAGLDYTMPVVIL